MGNDGGSIPKRRELVKEAARLPTSAELKATALESLAHAWSTCPISSEPLDPHNVVSDWRGRLYNFETVLRCMLPPIYNRASEEQQSQEAAEFARSGIRSLKDVVRLGLTIRKDEKRGEVITCPLSMRELGAATRAVYLVPCGHVFAETVMKELLAAEESKSAEAAPEKTSHCPECSEAFAVRDIVPILPVDESDVEKCTARIEELRALGLAHNLKKDKSAGGKKKKRKAAAAAEEEEGGKSHENGADGDKPAPREKKQKKDRDDISSRINNSMTATLTAKVLAEQEERNRQRKLAAGVR